MGSTFMNGLCNGICDTPHEATAYSPDKELIVGEQLYSEAS